MGFVSDLGEKTGLGSLTPGTFTSIFDPLDFLGTRSGEEARKAAEDAAAGPNAHATEHLTLTSLLRLSDLSLSARQLQERSSSVQ